MMLTNTCHLLDSLSTVDFLRKGKLGLDFNLFAEKGIKDLCVE